MTNTQFVTKATPGQQLDQFVSGAISQNKTGRFQFMNFQFELNGTEGYKEFCLIMAQYYQEEAANS